jgi:hypothetical protein
MKFKRYGKVQEDVEMCDDATSPRIMGGEG